MKQIALRSFQSEFSNILCVLRILLYSQNPIKYIVIIPSIYHIHRYYIYFNQAKQISNEQSKLWLLNIIDYYIIFSSSEYTEIKGIISGFVSFYFIYQYYPIKKVKKGFSNNIIDDLFMIILALIFMNINDKHIRFFGIREFVYHSLEFIYYY